MDFKLTKTANKIFLGNKVINICVLPALIITCATALASYWAFLVPIFQSPDEPAHADYIFTLYTKRKLIKAAEAPITGFAHPFIPYLLKETDGERVKFHPFIKMPSMYGSKQFFAKIDHDIPTDIQIKSTPYILTLYPVGYYALTALWLALLSHLSNSLIFLFFSARIFSVFLLGSSLVLSYLTMLELGMKKWQSYLILAVIGFFPLSSFVGSYIQPDNLAFAAMNACFYFAMRWKNNLQPGAMFLLGCSLAILLLAKYHFFCCVVAAITAMVISKLLHSKIPLTRTKGILSMLFIPSLIAGALQFWINYGFVIPLKNYTVNTTQSVIALHASGRILISHIAAAIYDLYKSLYSVEGNTFIGFWGKFGWMDTPLIIVNREINDTAISIIQFISLFILSLTLISLTKIIFNILRLVKRKRLVTAIFLACSNPVINTYFLFILFMFLFNIIFYPSYAGQGRQWFPLLLPIVLQTTSFAPRAFSSMKCRRLFFFLIATSWLIYSLIGNYYAIACIHKRYYEPDKQLFIDISKLRPVEASTAASIQHCDFLDDNLYHANTLIIPKGSEIDISGWAVDLKAQKTALAALLYIDDHKVYQPIYGLPSKEPMEKLHNKKYRFSGFASLIPTKNLDLGWHSLSVKIVPTYGPFLYKTNTKIKFLLVDH